MGRKKTICSVNAALQVDGKVLFTFRREGQMVSINQLPSGHINKIYWSINEMRRMIDQRFVLDKNKLHKEEQHTFAKIIRDVFSRYPNTPTLSRLRKEIDAAMENN